MSEVLIEIKNLRKDYFEVEAVKDISFNIKSGEIFSLIGPNGAGKTTLLRMLATSLKPTSGTAFISDLNILEDEIKIRSLIGFMPDFFMLYEELKVWEVLDFFARAHKITENEIADKIDEALNIVDLQNKKDSFVRGLSRGMMQRLGFARAIIHNPKLLLLDEPTSGLDPKARGELLETLSSLHKQGTTILISSHILPDLANFCTTFGIMEKGTIKILSREELAFAEKGREKIFLEVLNNIEETKKFLSVNNLVTDIEVKEDNFSFNFSGSKEDLANLNSELVKNNIKVVSLYKEQKDIQKALQQITEGETS